MSTSFAERFGLWSAQQKAEAAEIVGRIDAGEIDVLRFAWPDQHGVLRGKTLVAEAARGALARGINLTTTLLAKDTSHRSVFPVFSAGGGFALEGLQGGADFVVLPDPSTFRMLPWAPRTAWVLCDAYMKDGQPCPFATRRILQRALTQLGAQGLEFVAGLEVEFHVFKLDQEAMALADAGQPGTPPSVSLLTHGHQYLTELRYDRVDGLMELLRRELQALSMPLHSLEIEFGPSQFELVFGPTAGLAPADTMILLRSAIKQICQRHGYHATFMCRPRIPSVMSSGWHLHQSLRHAEGGDNAFMPAAGSADPLSPLGMQYLAGLQAHACGAAALASPTLNGYRRYRPFSLAPDRAIWAQDNRGAMLRVLGAPGDSASRIENRVGEPTANPYLYLASQIFSGLHGIAQGMDPGPSADAPYETPARQLPRSLDAALDALQADAVLVEGLGQAFVDYYCHIKRAEIARFNLEVTEWEHREYFDMF
ncbi:glutamine synthetase family protein [Xenophilus arseniciresistens]|uniref:Glutamine synthetase family protein n=1 Tax=Xenophilus arseniciresistens TaxID=1283306 RepID=A0AAE3NCH2_9BURK|nr:glutamine synthetase family protein [Xenophilus arseniciresistens]MDA7417807.1 glutamine synthetase family protein [Xenophilus arseniciresistens]